MATAIRIRSTRSVSPGDVDVFLYGFYGLFLFFVDVLHSKVLFVFFPSRSFSLLFRLRPLPLSRSLCLLVLFGCSSHRSRPLTVESRKLHKSRSQGGKNMYSCSSSAEATAAAAAALCLPPSSSSTSMHSSPASEKK